MKGIRNRRDGGNWWRAAITGGLAMSLTAPAGAVNFKLMDGALDASFDTTLSWGMTMRTERPNRELSRPSLSDPARFTQPGPGMYGDRFYDDKWDVVINRFKASHDFEITGSGWGIFVRGNYFYDAEADGKFGGTDIKLNDGAENKAVNGGSLTDAYVWWRMGSQDEWMIRLGKQVISWGENTFIGWAINDVNTVDISQLRAPGVELKDAFIGTPGLRVSWQATDSISFDAFTLFAYDEVKIDHSGGFFLTNDIFADDNTGFPNVDPLTGATVTPAGTLMPFGPAMLPFAGAPVCVAEDGGALGFQGICRTGDDIPSGWGQWGIAMNYYAANLGSGVDFGFYYQSLHDHVFRLGATAGDIFPAGGPPDASGVGRYFRDFRNENIERWGFSWNTTLGPWAWGGEYSVRVNDKLQESPANVLAWTILGANATPQALAGPPGAGAALGLPVAGVAPGTKGDFLEEFNHHQLQMTFQRLWGPMPMFLGADQWNTIAEVIHGWVTDMPDKDTFARFDGSLTNNWQGVAFVSAMTYNNALFNRANLEFRIAGKWDIRGQSPEFGGTKQFIEDRKQIGVGFNFDYRQRWKGGVNHVWFWGAGSDGEPKNASRDRDFLAFDLSYTF